MTHPALAPASRTGAVLDAKSASDLVAAYVPVDAPSAQFQKWFLDLITAHPGHFANRYNYDLGMPGHLTSQAIVYHPTLRAVALLHHKKLGIWVGQGGHVEPGDADLIATARREATEEAGLTDLHLETPAPFDLDVHGFPAKGDQPDHLHYDIRFLFTTTQETLIPNDESTQLEWVKISDLRARMGMGLPSARIVRALEARFPG